MLTYLKVAQSCNQHQKKVTIMTQVLIHTQNGTQLIFANNIIRIEASSNYSKLFLVNARPLTVAKVLHWFEDNLAGDVFYRIHKAHIVNRQFIADISADNNILTLLNGEQIKISRRRKSSVLQLLA